MTGDSTGVSFPIDPNGIGRTGDPFLINSGSGDGISMSGDSEGKSSEGEANGNAMSGDSIGKPGSCVKDGNSVIGDGSASVGAIEGSSGAAFVARNRSAEATIEAVRGKRAIVEVTCFWIWSGELMNASDELLLF